MMRNEKASLSVRRITLITILFIFICGISVIATNIKLSNVKIILSNNYEMNVLTTKLKVCDILEENHIVVLPEENVVPNLNSEISENKTITITKTLEEGQDAIKLAEANSEVSIEQLLGEYAPIIEKTITEKIEIPFSKKEFDIIEFLIANSGQVFDKEQIYEKIWGYDALGDNNVVKEHIRKIRAKFKDVTGKEYIDTSWGVGYCWKN